MGVPNLKEIDPQEECHWLAQSYFCKQCKEEKECEENVCMYINYIYYMYVATCVAMYKKCMVTSYLALNPSYLSMHTATTFKMLD